VFAFHMCGLPIGLNYFPDATILQLSQMQDLRRPNKKNLERFRYWLFRQSERADHFSNEALALNGVEFFTWADMKDLEDLVMIETSASERDAFQETIGSWIFELYSKLGVSICPGPL
jgi:hypothetical protein